MTLSSLLLTIIGLASAASMSSTPVLLMMIIIPLAAYFATLFHALFSSWMALTLFLIYIGAMLVMFAYFVAMSPNQFLSMAPVFAALALPPLTYLIPLSPTPNMTPLNLAAASQSPTTMLFNSPTPPIFLATILLLVLILVAKLTTRIKGPLRPFIGQLTDL